jgi:hypothetical protein
MNAGFLLILLAQLKTAVSSCDSDTYEQLLFIHEARMLRTPVAQAESLFYLLSASPYGRMTSSMDRYVLSTGTRSEIPDHEPETARLGCSSFRQGYLLLGLYHSDSCHIIISGVSISMGNSEE